MGLRMAEDLPRTYHDVVALEQLQVRVEGDLAERDDDADARQCGNLRVEMRQTPGGFFRRRLVVRRRAPDRRGDERVAQREAVVRVLRGGDVREAGAMERRHQEIPGAASAVAGEDAAGAVGAVRGGGEADDQ